MSQDARETKSYPESALNKLELFVGKKIVGTTYKDPSPSTSHCFKGFRWLKDTLFKTLNSEIVYHVYD